MTLRLYLFDDRVARGWEPFSLTRPVGELLHGALLLRERTERALGIDTSGYLGMSELTGFEEEGAPPVLPLEDLPEGDERILLSSRYVPPFHWKDRGPPLGRSLGGSAAERLILHTSDGSVVGWLLPGGHPPPSREHVADPASWGMQSETAGSSERSAARVEVAGSVLGTPWHLMAENPDRLARDLASLGEESLLPGDVGPLPDVFGVHRVGDHPVTVGAGVTLDPSVVLDTRGGPIHLADRVHVRSFTDLRGPAFIGPGSVLLGGVFEAIACGPVCKLRGEISTSMILGYSNKAHDGYLGHALVGRWVNLGAFTTNSDLKNNYGSVRVKTTTGERDTGLMKVGVFMGDHVKTGIGTLLNGGTVIGAGANVFGGVLPDKRVPPFGWGSGNDFVPYRLDAFLDTAERAMGRRGAKLTTQARQLFSRAWRTVHGSHDGDRTQ